MRVEEAALHYFVDLDAKIFRGRHFLGEFWERIQILVAIAAEHFPFDEFVEIGEVAHHSGLDVYKRQGVNAPAGLFQG